jgi:hypothetical protein
MALSPIDLWQDYTPQGRNQRPAPLVAHEKQPLAAALSALPRLRWSPRHPPRCSRRVFRLRMQTVEPSCLRLLLAPARLAAQVMQQEVDPAVQQEVELAHQERPTKHQLCFLVEVHHQFLHPHIIFSTQRPVSHSTQHMKLLHVGPPDSKPSCSKSS